MIRGTKRKIDKNGNVTRINPTVKASIHNRFDIEVVDSKTGEVKQKAYAENVVLDNWFVALAETEYNTYGTHKGGPATGFVFGSGSGLPASTDADLFSRFGYAASTDNGTWATPSKSCYSMTKKVSLSETQYVGKVFTEVGLCSSNIPYSNGNPSFRKTTTHAMLKDMNGNAVSLTKTDTDIFNIAATVFFHWDENGYGDGSIKITSSALKTWSYNGWHSNALIYFLVGVGYKSGDKFARGYSIYSSVKQESDNAMSFSIDSTGKEITLKGDRIPVGSSNLCACYATIHVVDSTRYNNASSVTHYKCPFIVIKAGGESIPGSQIKGETVATADGATSDFSTKFPYATNARIYVNGVEQSSGVAVSNGFVSSEKPGRYLLGVDEDSTIENIVPSQFPPAFIYDSSVTWQGDPSNTMPQDKVLCLYNPNYREIGWNNVTVTNTTASVYVKDGVGGDWVSTSKTLSGEKKNYPFMKIKYGTWNFSGDTSRIYVYTDETTVNNIHFDEPPPTGAIITADYFTETIAKDENHVFDLSLTIQLGEYTGE